MRQRSLDNPRRNGIVRFAKLFLVLLVSLAFSVGTSSAQRYMAALTGDVSDPTAAKIVGATVTATDTATNYVTKAVSNENGIYTFPFLTPDTYTITAEAKGFRTEERKGVVLTAGDNVQANFTLSVGASANITVTVNGGTQLLDTASANLGITITHEETTDLPNFDRDPYVSTTLAAGTFSGSFLQGTEMTSAESLGGFPNGIQGSGFASGHDRATLDGVPNDPSERIGTSNGNNYTGFVPSPESLQEVKAETAFYDAQYGDTGSLIQNLVLRSGTNQFHGAAYFLFRNTYLDANTSVRVPTQNAATGATPRANNSYNQPGFVFDGPVRIPHVYNGQDKTFFMVAYEHIQFHSGGAHSYLLPSPAFAAGDFSSLCGGNGPGTGNFNSSGLCIPGDGVQLYDPNSTLDVNNNRITYFPYNQIPSGRWSAPGEAMLKSYYPAANDPTPTPTINFISNDTATPNVYYSFVTRVDHSINNKNKFNGTFYKSILNQINPNEGFPTPIGPTGTDDLVYRNDMGGSFDYVSVLPKGYVMDARFGVIYHPLGINYYGSKFNLSTIGMSATNLAYQSFPGTNFSTDNYVGLEAGSAGQYSQDTLGSVDVLVSKTFGTHNMRFGFQGNLNRYNATNPISGLGTYDFNRQFTQKNETTGDSSSGNSMAALLLGVPDGTVGTQSGTSIQQGGYSTYIAVAIQQKYWGAFVQDDWRANNNVTLNFGLRYDDEIPYVERHNRMNAGFCTTCVNPLQASVTGLTLLGGLTFPGVNGLPRTDYSNDKSAFQPRFGVSYKLPERTRTVVHGGVGLDYMNTIEGPVEAGFSATSAYVATTNGYQPANNFSNPYPSASGVVQPTGSSLGLATFLGQGVNFEDPNHVQPRFLQWSLSTQTAVPGNMVVQLAYAGTKVWDWEINHNINTLGVQYLNQGQAGINYLNTKVANPMAGLEPTNGSLNGATILNSLLDLPFPEFGSVTELNSSTGTYLYNAFEVTVTKPMGHGLDVHGTFTWQKNMIATQYLNNTDPLPERYMDSNPNLYGDVAAMYKLPTFSGKPLMEREVLGGWQANGIFRLSNGSLVGDPGNGWIQLSNPGKNLSSASANTTPRSMQFNTCWENAAGVLQVTGVNISTPGCASASSVPAYQQLLANSLNYLHPNMTSVRTLVHPILDFSVFRVFTIHEGVTFEIRGEADNLFNTPNYGGPGTGPTSSNYGVISTSQINDPRLGELTARINF